MDEQTMIEQIKAEDLTAAAAAREAYNAAQRKRSALGTQWQQTHDRREALKSDPAENWREIVDLGGQLEALRAAMAQAEGNVDRARAVMTRAEQRSHDSHRRRSAARARI